LRCLLCTERIADHYFRAPRTYNREHSFISGLLVAGVAMPTSATAPLTILESILLWSANRPDWQRDALRRIVQKGKLDETDITELTALCLGEHGLAQLGGPVAVPLEKKHLPANPAVSSSVTLSGIRGISGVNHLAPGQNLTFSPVGLTIVYGPNGSGKSGYARILKRICRTRNPGAEILTNIYAPPNVPVTQEATIDYEVGGTAQTPLAWSDMGIPHPVLSAIGIFDSSCTAVHIGNKNEIAARPFGLDIPDELAGVCMTLEEHLEGQKKRLEKSRDPIFAKPPWRATTAVGRAIAALAADSDLAPIRKLTQTTTDEQKRIQQLKEDLARDPAAGARQLRVRISRIDNLVNAINAIEAAMTDAVLTAIRELQGEAAVARQAARISAKSLFSGQPLQGIGEPIWRQLWESARRYSEAHAYPGRPFPPAEAGLSCLLCQQALSEQAVARMRSFEDFVQDDTEAQAETKERAAQDKLSPLQSLKLTLKEYAVGLEEIAADDVPLRKDVFRYLASARLRRFTFLRSLRQPAEVTPTPATPASTLEQLTKELETRAAELDQLVDPIERRRREEELEGLEDRHHLASSISLVESEHLRLLTIALIEICLKDFVTTAITNLGNKLADEVVTPQLRDRFVDEVTSLASNKVRVEIARVGGRFGSPQYQVRFLARPDAKVPSVLSEGEQTCVALAAFLTEVATMDHHSTLVFDDPVTSLDHRWRKKVAERLVKEAAIRQVIVFTHDLVFVNDLVGLAHEKSVSQVSRSVDRGPLGTGIVEDGLPWQWKSVEDRLDKLEKRVRAANQLFDNSRDEEYRGEAIAIYNGLRATWERALESIAFAGVVQRHRDYIDPKNIRRAAVLTDSDCSAFQLGFKKCCDVTDAHDPSIGRNAEPPPPSEILKDIQDLKDWSASLRDRHKLVT
jgi:energy-coupling factor transporter ATP-binding protein EcfA2